MRFRIGFDRLARAGYHADMDAANITIPSTPGTYVLIVVVDTALSLAAGRLGYLSLPPGQYAYVGSARGPGGLRARLGRHMQPSKPQRWHIDYLTTAAPIIHVHFQAHATRLECRWAQALSRLSGAETPAPHFGSSDCRNGCAAHLIRLPDDFDIQRLGEILPDA